MRGCLVKRYKGEIWYAKIPVNGKQKWYKIGSCSKHEAQRALRKKLDELERNFGRDIQRILFKDLMKEWLESQRLDKKPKTIANYTFQTSKHLLSFFGDMMVSKILPADVERFKRENTQKVSATTVNYHLRLIRSILDCGIRWGYLYTNPAKLVKRLHQGKKPFPSICKEDLHNLLEAADLLPSIIHGQPKTIILTALLTGVRMGELLGMKWQNLNWQNATYMVKESYSTFGFETPKTESSYRVVDLPLNLIQALKAHRLHQNEHRLRMGSLWHDIGLIFTTEAGTPINPSNLRNRIFYPSIKKIGLPKTIRFHDLRGIYATLLLESNAPVKYVQDQLGHRTPGMTIGVYAKVTQEGRKQAQERFQAYVENI